MKIEFESLIRRLSFLCHIPDIKNACINPCQLNLLLIKLLSNYAPLKKSKSANKSFGQNQE